MEVYRKMLSKNIWKFTITKKKWWDGLFEYLNLSLNRWSSFHGNNWIRATIMTLVINGIFFTLYCRCLGSEIDYSPEGWHTFRQLFSYSFEFLNPLRKADFLKEAGMATMITAKARTVDYISRIVVSYFAYQTIQAFRKHGKSGA